MKKIDKLFVKSFIGPFALTTSIVVFIFLMRFLMIYFNEFIGKDLDPSVFSKLFFYFTLITIPTSLPLATVLATLMCFGNLGEHSELAAMKSAGIPLTRLILPTFVLSMMVAIFSFFYNNVINPWANLKGWSLLYDIKSTKLALNIQEGIFYNELPGYRIKIGKKAPDGVGMKDVVIYDHTAGGSNKNITLADSGRMYTINHESQLVFELFNGTNYTEGNNYNTVTQLTKYGFQKNKMVFSLNSFGMNRTDENEFLYHEYMKSIPELNQTIDSLTGIIEEKNSQQKKVFKGLNSYDLNNSNWKDSIQKAILPGPWIDSLVEISLSRANVRDFTSLAMSKIQSQISQLQSDIVYQEAQLRPVWSADLERWNKVTTAMACLTMFLIGASLGSIIKKGGFGMPVLVSIAFFILYYILQQIGTKYTREGIIPAIVGAWMPFTILLIIGIFLMRKAKSL